jgi:hypothetical protein
MSGLGIEDGANKSKHKLAWSQGDSGEYYEGSQCIFILFGI